MYDLTKFKPTEQILLDFMPELAFEVYQFRNCQRLGQIVGPYGREASPPLSQVVNYTLLLHFRILLEFLYSKPKKDDIRAGYFKIVAGVDRQRLTEIPESPKWNLVKRNDLTLQEHLNKRLARLTPSRIKSVRPDMDYYRDHFAELDATLESLIKILPKAFQDSFAIGMGRWETRDAEYFRNR